MTQNIEENWTERLKIIKHLMNTWSKRDLSMHGKVVIIKTFLLSQFNFVMQSIGLPETVLTTINTLLYKFLWQRRFNNRKAFEKIKRGVLQQDYDIGGLKMVDMRLLQQCYYLQWAGKLYKSKGENWTCIPKFHLSKIATGNRVFEINGQPRHVKLLHDIENTFWKTVLTIYLQNKELETEDVTKDDFHNQLLFNNSLVQYRNKSLHLTTWKNKGLELVKDIINIIMERYLFI